MIFQCVPNFSEGRNLETLAALADVMRTAGSAKLIDYSADWDHNRSVYTLLGDADGIFSAMMAAARVAVKRIDMGGHRGVHPCAGAVDVVPVVPLREATWEDAILLAERLGQGFAGTLKLPVRFYERNTRSGKSPALPVARNAVLRTPLGTGLFGEAAPDLGNPYPHYTAGVVIVGARAPLVAYNVNLDTADVAVAQEIARHIRHERDANPTLTGVRALGLLLTTPNHAQVSMNVTQPDKTPLPPIFRWIRSQAVALGTDAKESEIIGAIPRRSLNNEPPSAILWHRYKETQILETWLGDGA
jgi:glutamate formiminotransferase